MDEYVKNTMNTKKHSCICIFHVNWKIKNLFFFPALYTYICEEENAINRCLADIKSKDGKRRTVKKKKNTCEEK